MQFTRKEYLSRELSCRRESLSRELSSRNESLARELSRRNEALARELSSRMESQSRGSSIGAVSAQEAPKLWASTTAIEVVSITHHTSRFPL